MAESLLSIGEWSKETSINRPPAGGDLAFSWKKGHISMNGCVLLALLQCDAVCASASAMALLIN